MKYIYSDINLALLKNPASFDIVKRFDVEAVKSAVRNILLTRKGEKLFNPEFGANLDDLLFELITPAVKLFAKRRIVEEIMRWEPRIVITNVDIQTSDDTIGTLSITVEFYVQAIPKSTTSVTVSLKRTR